MSSAAEKEYRERVREQGCVMCRHLGLEQTDRTEIHHLREGEGGAQRAPDWLSIALCTSHHVGPSGWHGLGKRAFYTRYGLDEMDLLAMAIEGVQTA